MKDTSVIPKGHYCYTRFTNKTKVCPYWRLRKDRGEQENGYCDFLGKGDYEINREVRAIRCTTYKDGTEVITEVYAGPDNPSFFSLLWDHCKECEENEYTEEEWEELFNE